MRKVLYIQRLDDGASVVMVYRGKMGKGTLREYGVQSSKRVERLHKICSNCGNQSEYLRMNVYAIEGDK